MAEAMILLVVEKLETLLVDDGDVFSIVGAGEEQVKGLRDKLREMLPLLKDTTTKKSGDIHTLKELAHDADAAIDLFIFFKHVSSTNIFERIISRRKYRAQFLEKISGISRSLKGLKRDFTIFEEAERPTRSMSRRIPESQVVGLKEDVRLLLREAIFDEAARKGLATSCIVGMGGVGKTALAGILYDHERVASEFELRAWVCVSSEFSAKEVLKELILQFGMEYEQLEMTTVYDLRGMVFQHLRSRRYFIVLDHVWRDAGLEEFVLTVFPDNGKASRLVVTSRIRDIIGHAQYIHERKILDPNESWKLFLKTVFGEYTKCPNHLEEIGRKIVAICDGLPLAIIEAGDKLSEKEQSESEWASFLESMDLSSTLEVLELSYHKMLSPIIKSCFLHLGSFMEATTIRVQKFIQVWNAGGVLVSQGEEKNETDEEIGRKCLDELINQCVLEIKERSNRDYRVKYCHMNKNLHRLAVKLAKEEIRFVVRSKNEGNSKQSRHCVIYCSREKFDYNMDHEQLVVSLLFRGGGRFDAGSYNWGDFNLLRIIDFEGFGLKNLLGKFGWWSSLKYLGLRNNYIEQLPRSLARLKGLEVLDIVQNFTVEVPDIIWKMNGLCHLYMSDIVCPKPLKIDALKNIQTLTYISVDNWVYELAGLEIMNNLCKLGIEELDGTSDVSKTFASLAKLENLDCLILRGSRFRSMPSLDELGILNRLTQLKLDGLLTKLPSASNFPPNICYLTLVNTSFDEDPMPVLEKLSKLVFIKLRNAFTGEQMMVSHLGFAELEGLCVGELWHLRNLQIGEGAMPKLKLLEINNCPYLETLPEEIKLMANLKELKMVTTKSIARKIVETGLGLISKRRHVDIQP